MDLALERYDANSVRLMRGGQVVGMLLKLCNDRWTINDRNERPLTNRTFRTPKDALSLAQEIVP